jgi:hypothetical protein
MTWSTPYSPTTGDVVSAANLTTYKDDLTYLHDRKGAKVYKGIAQSIPNNAITTVTFGASDTEAYDPLNMHDPVTNNSRLVVPAGYDGIWVVYGLLGFAVNATGARILFLLKNGAQIARADEGANMGGPGTQTPTVVASIPVAAVAGDYFEMQAYQNSTAALNLGTGEGNVALAAHWLSA